MNKIVLESDSLILRDIKETDTINIFNKVSPLNVRKYLSTVPQPYTLENAQEFVKMKLDNQLLEKRTSFDLAITQKSLNSSGIDSLELIGIISLSKIDYFMGKATIGYWLGEEYWGKGIMSKAVKRVIEFAFNDLNLNRIEIEAVVENIGSNKVIQKNGFVFECVQKQAMRSKATGKLHDGNTYSLLKEDWGKSFKI